MWWLQREAKRNPDHLGGSNLDIATRFNSGACCGSSRRARGASKIAAPSPCRAASSRRPIRSNRSCSAGSGTGRKAIVLGPAAWREVWTLLKLWTSLVAQKKHAEISGRCTQDVSFRGYQEDNHNLESKGNSKTEPRCLEKHSDGFHPTQ